MKTKKAISLIVLVVTIIVLAILAATVILIISNSGIINNFRDSRKNYDFAQIEEIANLAHMEALIDPSVITDADYQKYVEDYLKNSDIKQEYLDRVRIVATVEEVKVFDVTTGPFINVKDYGAKGDGTTDDTVAIRSAVDELNKNGGTLYFPKGTYVVSVSEEDFSSQNKLNSSGDVKGWISRTTVGVIKLTNTQALYYIIDFDGSTLKLNTNSYPTYSIISASGCNDVEIKNGTLIGDATTHIYKYINSDKYSTDDGSTYRACTTWLNSSSAKDHSGDGTINSVDYYIGVKGLTSQYGTHEFGFGIVLADVRNAKVNSMKIEKMTGDAIIVSGDAANTTVDKCDLSYCRRQGISILNSDTTIVQDSKVYKIGNSQNIIGTAPMYGIDIEPDEGSFCAKKVLIDKCEILQNTGGAIIDQYKRALYIEVLNSKLENSFGLAGNVGGRVAKLENCDLIINEHDALNEGLVVNCRCYLGNIEKDVFINNSVIKNCVFSGIDENTETSMRIYITGSGELTNCKFYNIKGAPGVSENALGNTWGILFAVDASGTKQATGELVNNNNYYENCDMWCQVFNDNQGFEICDSEFNKCNVRTYNISLRDTTINNCTTYLIDLVKKYNCYIDNVYYNEE